MEVSSPYRGAPPAVASSATSGEAASSMARQAGTLRDAVLMFLESRGGYGATDEEVQDHLLMPPNTSRPRRRELVLLGLIHDSGQVRTTRSGRAAVVWRAGPPAVPLPKRRSCPTCHGKGTVPLPPPPPPEPAVTGPPRTQLVLFPGGVTSTDRLV